MKHLITSSALLLLPLALSAQDWRLEDLMKGDGFIGRSPENPEWSFDGKSVYFDWNPNNEPGNSPYRYTLSTDRYEQLSFAVPAVPAAPPDRTLPADYYFNELGDIVRYNARTQQRATVLSQRDGAGNVQRVKAPEHIYFTNDNNLFLFDAASGGMRQVTNFQRGSAPGNKDSSSLQRQQAELFSYVREERDTRKWQETHRYERKFPKAVYYSSDEQLENITVSQDERFVAFRLGTYPEDPATYIEEYITQNGYTNRVPARAKVGNQDPSHRFGIYDRQRDTAYYVSFAGLSEIRKKPAYLSEYGKGDSLYEKDRNIVMHRPVMHPDGSKAVIDVRSYDNKDRWIVLIDLATGKITELDHQHDEAWIGGPGISSWNAEEGTLGWLDANTIYFQSENPSEVLEEMQLFPPATKGYSHLYILDVRRGTVQHLTSGNWEVYDVQLSRDKQTFYLLANKLHPGVRNGYKLSVKDRKLVPLFEGYFGIEWKLSPDEKRWAIRHSTPTQPWDLYIAENKPGAAMKRITHTASKAYEQLPLQAPKVIQVPASDGKEVTARLYQPEHPNGAAVLFVHGAGYLQNAHHYWSYYCREFLFNQLLAQQGYTVLDIDYRASEGYGRDVRTAVYRDMGNRDLQDYIDGKKFLVEHYGVDSSRVGIYGGSYGGFITLMSMLKTPGTFACGAALRAVTDWEHYNHEYTSNILNYPGTDPKAYRRSSPIYYADGLNGPLLLLHGMEDDNVQIQDVIRLNQRFIELGKTNYQLSVFPTEAHGFRSTAAWTDEYRRIYELFERELKR